MRGVCLLALALVACGTKRRGEPDADVARDAPAVTSDADRASLFRQVPTEQAIRRTVQQIGAAPHPAGTPANEAVAKQLLATLGRMNLKTGVTQHEVWLPATDGWLVPLDPKPRVLRNFMVIIGGRSEDAVVVGTRYDATDTSLAHHANVAALVEVARGFTALTRAGWRPARTIILAFWDGGLVGDLGLSAWVDDQATMLGARALAYLELGSLAGSALAIDRTDALAAVLEMPGSGTGPRTAALGPLTTGATAFWHRTAVASAQWRMIGEPPSDEALLEEAADVARSIGLAALHLADAPHVELRYDRVAELIDREVAAIAQAHPGVALDRTGLDAARGALAALLAQAPVPPTPSCDQAYLAAERAFLLAEGLTTRPWYRHVLLGPTRAGDIALVPELADAVAADDAGAAAVALRHLTTALERLNATLGDCKR